MSGVVQIKNMPLAFLRNKPDGFFESSEYKEFKKLFDTLKPSTSDSPKEEDNSLPLDFLKGVILRRWQGLDYDSEIISDDDKLKKLICILTSRSLNKIETSPRSFINRTCYELDDSRCFRIKEHISSSLINEIQAKRKTLNSPENSLTDKLPPPPSGDPVKDVARKSSFYKSVFNSTVYDDKFYKRLVTSMNAINGLISLSMSPVDIVEESIASYSYTFKDVDEDIHILKERILDRFEITNVHTYSYNTPAIDEKDVLAKTVSRHYNNMQNAIRLGAYYHLQVAPLSTIEIDRFNDSTKFRFRFFNRNGEVKNILTSYNIINNKLIINLNKPFNGYIGIIFDRLDDSLIESYSLYNYFKITKNIISPLGQIFSGNSVKVYMPSLQSLPFDYVFYDQFQNKLMEPDKVEFHPEYVEFFGNFNDNRYVLYLLDFRKILSGSSVMKVFPKDVYRLMDLDLIHKEYEVW